MKLDTPNFCDKDTPTKRPRGSSVSRTQDTWITSQTVYTQEHPALVLTTLTEKIYENIVGTGENTGNQMLVSKTKSKHLFCRLQMLSIWSR